MGFTWLVAGLGFVSPADAGTLRLMVVDSADAPVGGSVVELATPGAVSQFGSTDVGGALVAELDAGNWRVVVRKPGFAAATTSVVVPEVGEVPLVVKLAAASVLTKEFMERIPAGRTYQTAVQTAPGVQAGAGGNPSMGGGAWIDTEQYVHPGHGPLVMADQDPLSTFAIDVDTASYALSRAKLDAGTLPVPASVRVEEFVNAFEYDWAPPSNADPLAVRLEVAPHPLRDDRVVLSVALQGKRDPSVQKPVRLTFLVDVSGSMASADKLVLARQSLHHLVDGLGVEDRVAIATYAGNTGITLQPSWTVHKAPIHSAIDTLVSGGGTAMGDGISLAYGMASEMYVEGAENRVVILTDGDANVGRTSAEQLLELVDRWAGDGITLSVVGFGQGNYKDALLERLADEGDGNYHFVDELAEAKRVFGRDLTSNLVTVARDVKVQIAFPNEAVLAWRQIGYENRAVADADFRVDAVDGGEVGVGHQVTALYELVLRDKPVGDLARVNVRAKPPGKEAAAVEYGSRVSVDAVRGRFSSASNDLQWATGVAMFAELLRRSPHLAEVRWADVLAILDRAYDPSDVDRVELRELVIRAAELSGGLDTIVIAEPVTVDPSSNVAR